MTIFDYLEIHSRLQPDRIALSDEKGVTTYQELFQNLGQYSVDFENVGKSSANRVILKRKQNREWVQIFLELIFWGIWVIPVAPDVTDYEIDKIMMETKTTIMIDQTFQGIPSKKATNFQSGGSGIIHMTSGTTGNHKFCLRTILSLTNEGKSYQKTFGLSENDRMLALPPLSHSFALGAGLMGALVSGAALYTFETFSPMESLNLIEEKGIHIIFLVPAMAKLFCQLNRKENCNMQKSKHIVVGAGSISKELYDSFYNKFGVYLKSNYGSTETGALMTRLENEPYNSIGKPMDGVNIKLIKDSEKLALSEEEGRVWVKSTGMLNQYIGNCAIEKDVDGYIPMNDIAYQSKEGFYYLIGRVSRIINIGGKKVAPDEVEETLLSIPQIKDCVVVEEKGRVKAFVVGERISEQEIRDFCYRKLSNYKIPGKIQYMNKIPRNSIGKIIYQKLK